MFHPPLREQEITDEAVEGDWGSNVDLDIAAKVVGDLHEAIGHRLHQFDRIAASNKRHAESRHGADLQERVARFERTFADRLRTHDQCRGTIVGEGHQISLIVLAARILEKECVDDLPEDQRFDVLIKTGECLTRMILAFLFVDEVKALLM